jgi:hypothetical protein
LDCTSFLVYPNNKYEHRLKHYKATKIVIKSLAPHRNIPLIINGSTKMINSVVGIFVCLIYLIDKGMHNSEHSAISNRKIILKLLIWKLLEKIILSFSFHWNNSKPILINKSIKEMKYKEEISLSFEIKFNIRMLIWQTIRIHLGKMVLPYKKERLNTNFIKIFPIYK